MVLTRAARLRRDYSGRYIRTANSRAACWVCGLREQATIHGDEWWQHQYQPGILTRVP